MLLSWLAIDPHVHDRDEEESEKTTIAETIELALSQGVGIIFGMPNTKRPVTNRQRVWERLALVPKGKEKHYRLYVGLTGDESQILEALWCYDNIPKVIGFKMFVGKSVGNLSVVDVDIQRRVYKILVRERFLGVLALHCEKEILMNPKIWDPTRPITHGRARPEVAEIGSAIDQIAFALAEHYIGRIHICHVSSPMTVHLVDWAKSMGLRISCGLTPHHTLWDDSMMNREDGLTYKMNPPLRGPETVSMLRGQLVAGMIDVIETDHAPHTATEKRAPQCLSGYPSLTIYNQFVTEFLPSIGLTQSQIKALNRDNVLEIFGDKLEIAA